MVTTGLNRRWMQTLDKYLELYQSNREQIGRDDPPFLTEQRELAIAAFRRSGFPERKEERYKYTHLETGFRRGPQLRIRTPSNIFR